MGAENDIYRDGQPALSLDHIGARIVGVFGGPDELRAAVNQLQELLYAP